jgi:hypothetical protein
MLIGPALWSFGTKPADGPYPYQDTLTVTGGKVKTVTVSASAVT